MGTVITKPPPDRFARGGLVSVSTHVVAPLVVGFLQYGDKSNNENCTLICYQYYNNVIVGYNNGNNNNEICSGHFICESYYR